MVENERGFLEAEVDESQCTHCDLCKKVCPVNQVELRPFVSGFAGWSRDDEIVKKSASGGVVYEFSRYALAHQSLVCCAEYNPHAEQAVHRIDSDPEQLSKTQGSVYLQSQTLDAFLQMKRGGKCLVVGTPCQIAGIRNLAKLLKREEDWFLVDFFCHGVPSKNLWKSYLRMHGIGKHSNARWRNKEGRGWKRSYHITVEDEDGCHSLSEGENDLFFTYFLGGKCMNSECYTCPFRGTKSSADLRVGDAWSYAEDEQHPGANAIAVFSKRGEEFLHQISRCHLEEWNHLQEEKKGSDLRYPEESYEDLLSLLSLNLPLDVVHSIMQKRCFYYKVKRQIFKIRKFFTGKKK